MPGETITSPRNPRIAATASLERASVRKRERRTVIEGPQLVEAAVRGAAVIHDVFALEGDDSIQTFGLEEVASRVTPTVLGAVAATENPRGPVAVIEMPEPEDLVAQDTLVLYGVGDPGNAGTLMRTAGAFGLQVVATPGTVDLWAPKVLRAAAGAHWAVRIAAVEDPVSGLRDLGVTTVATVVAGGMSPDRALASDGPVAILVGSEPHGLPASVAAETDRQLTVPMPGAAESLNVAVAGSIAIYELGQQRHG